jgi:hypothetical protein
VATRNDRHEDELEGEGHPELAAATNADFAATASFAGYFGLRQNISFSSHFFIIGAPRFELGTSSPPD